MGVLWDSMRKICRKLPQNYYERYDDDRLAPQQREIILYNLIDNVYLSIRPDDSITRFRFSTKYGKSHSFEEGTLKDVLVALGYWIYEKEGLRKV